jgi:hypothetical protein
MQTSKPESEMSFSDASSEAGYSDFRDLSESGVSESGVSETGDVETPDPFSISIWLRQSRREDVYTAGQLSRERTKQYFKTVNDIITSLQCSGFRIEVLEPQVRTCQSFIPVKVSLTTGTACSTRHIVSRRRNRLVSGTRSVLKRKLTLYLQSVLWSMDIGGQVD